MAESNEDIKWLYGKLKAKGYNIGSEEEFSSSLANEDDRKWYYDKATKMGLNMGSMDDFDSLYAPKPTSQPQTTAEQPQTTPQSAVGMPQVNAPSNTPSAEEEIKVEETVQQNAPAPAQPTPPPAPKFNEGNVISRDGKNYLFKGYDEQGNAMLQPEGQTNTVVMQPQMLNDATLVSEKAWQPTEQQKIETSYNINKMLNDFNEQSKARLEQSRRVAERNTPEGRAKQKAGEMQARMAGTPTSVGIGQPQEGSPVPYGVTYENGEAKSQWLLPDGTLTTDLAVAQSAEDNARAERLQGQFIQRMKSNGLDPSKQEDIDKQATLDLQQPAIKAAEELWQEAERLHKEDRNKNAKSEWGNYAMMGGGREMRMVTAGANRHKDMVSHMTRFDIEKMMDKAWDKAGGKISNTVYDNLRRANPDADETELKKQADEIARQLTDNAVYEYAVKQNTPKSTLEYFGRTVADMNLINSIARGLARSEAGTSGDLAAYEQAMDAYGKNHRVAQIAGTVTGMAVDPTTWLSGGVGSWAGKGAVNLGGRLMMRNATRQMGARAFGSTLTGRIVAGTAGAAGNLATYEGMKEGERQWVHGGYINPETGENEGYKPKEILKSSGHGAVMGSFIGPAPAIIGNVADKVVKTTSSTAGKMALRGGEVAVSTLAEGTIFALPEIIEFQTMDDNKFDQLYAEKFGYANIQDPERKAEARNEARNSLTWDTWTDSQAMMLGFKAQHGIKSVPKVIQSLRPIKPTEGRPLTQAERNHNRMDFMERVRNALDGQTMDMALTAEERDELRRKGYGELGDLFTKDEKKANHNIQNESGDLGTALSFQRADSETVHTRPEFEGYSEMEAVMGDPNVSEATRAKLWYIFQGHMLPMSTIVGYNESMTKDENGKEVTYVDAVNADGGVVISRKYTNRKEAEAEMDRIARQAELNSIDVGERYKEAEADNVVLDAAINQVARGADHATIRNIYERAKAGDPEITESQKELVDVIDEAIKENKGIADEQRPEGIRNRIKEETGVDVDKALKKSRRNRTEEENKAIEAYAKELFPEQKEQEPTAEQTEAQSIYEESKLLPGRFFDEQGATPQDPNNPTPPPVKSEIDAIVYRMQEAYQLFDEAFGGEADYYRFHLDNDPWGLVNDPTLTPEQKDAVLYYINSKAALDGVMDGANEAAQNKMDIARQEIDHRTNKDSGMVQPAVMKLDDKPVYIVKGNVVMFPDGSAVDRSKSSDSLIILDPADPSGEYKWASVDEIYKVDEPIDPQEQLAEVQRTIDEEQNAMFSDLEEGNNGAENIPQNGNNGGENIPTEIQEPGQEGDGRVPENADLGTGGVPNEPENVPNAPQDVPTEVQDVPTTAEITGETLSTIPIDETTGEPIFEAVDHVTAWKGLMEATGNEQDSYEIAQAQVRQIKEDLDKLRRKPPVMTVPKLKGSPMAMAQAKRAATEKYQQELEAYNNEISGLESKLQAWENIEGMGKLIVGTLKAEERARQEEQNRIAHDEAVARFEEQQRIKAEKEAEQAEIGTHAVNPKIKEKWDNANKLEGNADEITLPDGSTISGHYVLAEAGAATPSHDVNNAFTPTEGFPIDENGQSVNDRDYQRDKDAQRIVETMGGAYDSRALQTPVIVSKDGVVLSGNNRTMSGELAARQGTDKAYVDYLRKYGAKYGFTPEVVDGFNNPRLVFVPDEDMPYDATTFSRFNAQEMKSQSKPEAAVKLGKVVPDNVFSNIVDDISRYDRLSDFYADEKAVAQALGQLLQAGVINDKQMPELRTGTSLSAAGKELIENVLIGKVFQTNPDAVRQIISIPTLRQSVVMGLSEIANNRTLSKQGYDLSEELAKAVDLVARAKTAMPDIYTEGMPVSPFGRQAGLFDDEFGDSRVKDATTLLLADILNSGRPSDLRKVLATYNAEASQSAAGQYDMFGGGILSKEDILTQVNEHFRNATPKEQQALVDTAIAERKRRAEESTAERAEQPSGGGEGGEQVENADERSAEREQPTPVAEGESGLTPEEEALEARLTVTDNDWTEGEGDNPTYKRDIIIDGKHTVVQVDKPDEKGNYKGSYFEYDGKKFGDIQEVAEYIDNKPATVGERISEAEAEVNTNPTEAQKEAGNYKKGHVQIGTFDVTIENPKGSVRSGKDRDGKEWSVTMQHTYGYIRGTKGVDGDHIDVYASSDIDGWDGRKVFVVDQYNPDGTFDEHKVMLGFNDKDEAYNAYLSNYEKGWENSRRLDITSTNIEDFEKWIESSKRKTKPFAEYKTVKKDEIPTEVEEKAEQPEVSEERKVTATITPTTYTNKKGKTSDISLVKFSRDLTAEEKQAVNALIKEPLSAGKKTPKGWYDREQGGYMMRSEEAAQELVSLIDNPEGADNYDKIADKQPLSKEDIQSAIKEVDIEGVFKDLNTKGETKLSDHAKPVKRPANQKTIEEVVNGEEPRATIVEDVVETSTPGKSLNITEDMKRDEDILRDLLGIGDDEVDGNVRFADVDQLTPQQKRQVYAAGVNYAMGYIDQGIVSFEDFARSMSTRLGEKIKPWLKSFYEGVKRIPGYEDVEFTPSEEVDKFDVDNIGKPGDVFQRAETKVEERKVEKAVEQAEKELIEQRNEQRKQEDEQTTTDTKALEEEARAVEKEADAISKTARTSEEIEVGINKIDDTLNKINEQLALLGYYEADLNSPEHEIYGLRRSAEKKAVADASKLAKQLVNDLGLGMPNITSEYTWQSKKNPAVRANIAPSGGEITIHLRLGDTPKALEIQIGVDPSHERGDFTYNSGGGSWQGDNYQVRDLWWRITQSNIDWERVSPDITYADLLGTIKKRADKYLPKSETPAPTDKPVAPTTQDTKTAETAPKAKELPILKQYDEMKKKHPDAILLFRVGDFYEVFKQDAKDASGILGITLTKRSTGDGSVEMAGFPHHALDTYLPKLVRAGRRVAICEQLEDPKLTKKLEKRPKPTETPQPKAEETKPTYPDKNDKEAVSEWLFENSDKIWQPLDNFVADVLSDPAKVPSFNDEINSRQLQKDVLSGYLDEWIARKATEGSDLEASLDKYDATIRALDNYGQKPNMVDVLLERIHKELDKNPTPQTVNGYKVGDEIMYNRNGAGKWERLKIVGFEKDGRPTLDSFGAKWITEIGEWENVRSIEDYTDLSKEAQFLIDSAKDSKTLVGSTGMTQSEYAKKWGLEMGQKVMIERKGRPKEEGYLAGVTSWGDPFIINGQGKTVALGDTKWTDIKGAKWKATKDEQAILDILKTGKAPKKEEVKPQETIGGLFDFAEEEIPEETAPATPENAKEPLPLEIPEERPVADLSGDSADFQKKEKQTKALVAEIGLTISDRLAEYEKNRETKPLTMRDVRKLADEYSELKDISDTDLQELVELAMTQLTRNTAMKGMQWGNPVEERRAFDKIVGYYQMQPSLNARDSERLIKQQYSTPTPFGFVMGQFVQAKGKSVNSGLEPSAGNGALTITLNPKIMHVNDIDQARLANLRKLGFGKVTAQNALLPFEGDMVDVVLTNPPFGTIEEKVYDGVFKISSLEGQMAINALDKMKDNGRAAIVIGGNTSYRTNGSMNPKDAAFFGYLYSHYNVADVINISGKALYSRNGTGYDVRMILIDGRKTGPFQRVFPPVQSKARAEQVTTFDELYNRVQNDISNLQQVGDRPASAEERPGNTANGAGSEGNGGRSHNPNAGAGERPSTPSKGVGSSPQSGRQTSIRGNEQQRTDRLDNGNGGNATSVDNVFGGNPDQSNGRGNNGRGNDRGTGGTDGREAVAERPASSGGRLDVTPKDKPTPATQDSKPKREEVKADLTTEKVPYPNQSNNGFTLLSVVPAAQAEPLQRSLGEIGDVDQYLVDNLGYSSKDELYGYLAAEQIDSVALAINQMGKGNAFIIGDMTGVGKGRQGAALIRYAVKKGKTPIYFTQKPTLFTDNYRDLSDIGSGDLRPFIIASNPKDANIVDVNGKVVHKLPSEKERERVFNHIMKTGELPKEYDYVLTTYDQIKNGTKDYEPGEGGWNIKDRDLPKKSKGYTTADYNGQKRRDALAILAIGNITILDESHTVGGDSGCGRYMQMLTNSARGVTFLSATFAKRADNMPIYAQRTAMSEAGVTQQELIEAINKGGVTLQEIMSKQLVESGQMIRRERSFEGVTIDWLNVEEETDQRQRAQFNEVAKIFNDIRNFQDEYITPWIEERNKEVAEYGATAGHTQGTKDMGVKNVPFASKMYNLVNQLLFALKVDAVADRVIWNLQNGYKPVISFTNTMEGFLSEAPKGVEMDEVPDFSLTLMRALDGVMRYTTKDADDNSEGSSINFSELPPEAQAAYNEIRQRILNLSADLPISPMDAIRMKIEEAGYSVAEITGRTLQLDKTANGKYMVSTRKDRDKKANMRDFNSGKLDVLMINKSGSTGISLHASSKFEDQRQRVMVFAQFQSDINDEVQMRGRIDRSGQVTRGRYEYIMSTIPAEQRIQMMFKAKLKSLDANTTSSQKSKFNEMEIVDYLNKYGDEVVWDYMTEHPELEERLGDPLDMLSGKRDEEDKPNPMFVKSESEKKSGAAGKISRYLAFLPVEEQDAIFKEITEAYKVKMQLLDDAGENDLEITTMPLNAETISKKIWQEGSDPNGSNAFADNTYVEEVEVDVLKKPMKKEEIEAQIRRNIGDDIQKATATEHDQYRFGFKEGEINWKRYADKKTEEIKSYYRNRADETIARMQESAAKKVAKEKERATNIMLKERAKGNNDYTDQQIAQKAEEAAQVLANTEKLKQDETRRKTMAIADRFEKLLNHFSAGQVFVVPQNLKMGDDGLFTQTYGIFTGFKFNKTYTLGSSTATFATLDGRRKVELALSDPAIETILRATTSAYQYFPKEIRALTLDNWDEKVPNKSRQKRYIITGNLLQALVDTNKGGATKGNLISYTTKDGDVKQGILMSENFKPSDLRNSAPISSKLTQIRQGDKVTSENGEVTVERVHHDWLHRGQYALRVPKSKQKGGQYSTNETLMKLSVGSNFVTKGNNMIAYYEAENLPKVLDILSRPPFNVTVLEASRLDDTDSQTNGEGNKYRLVEDKETLDFLEGHPTKKGYRYAQWANMGVLPPMTAKQNGEWRSPMVFPKWEQSEEGMRKENGKADLVQGNGRTTGDVAYNPYFHIRTSPLNDQFTAAYDRPELLVVEGSYPESEETSGYKAEGAKDSVGLMDWHSGSVNGQLSRDTKVQTMLSRYFKPERIVPWSEVADLIMERIGDQKIEFPINVVPPMLRSELAKRGIKFSSPSGTISESDRAMLEDLKERVNNGEHEAGLEKAQSYLKAYESSTEAKTAKIEELSEKLHMPVRIISDVEAPGERPLTSRERRAKGWYDIDNNEVVIVEPNNVNVADVENTFVHEVVGHKGLRVLVGEERMDEFVDEIYNHASDKIKATIDKTTQRMVDAEADRLRVRKSMEREKSGEDVNANYYADMAEARVEAEGKREKFRREATEEYMSDMAGRIGDEGFEKMSQEEQTLWGRIKAKVQQFLDKFLKRLKIAKGIRLNDKDIAYILYKSWKNMRDIFDRAEDVNMRRKTGYDADDVKRYRDPGMGLEETISRLKAEAVQANSDNLQVKRDAMRAIGGNLNHLRSAMARQREYDITTVKGVSDLAKVLMDNNLLDDLSKAETKRILGAMPQSIGTAGDSGPKRAIDRIMGIMIDNQLRMGQKTFSELLSIKGSRVDARGVEVQGVLDPDGQRMAQVVKKALTLPKDDIETRIAEALNRMGSSDQATADEAAIEYAGLQVAHQYATNITESKAEEKDLRESLKQAKEDKDAGQMTEAAYKQYVQATEDSIRQNKIERAEAYQDLIETMSGVLGESVERAKAWKAAEVERVKAIQHNANSDMEGRPTDEHHKNDKVQKLANNSGVRFLLAPLGTFDQMLRMFGKKNARGEGYLWNRYMRGWVDATEKEYTGYRDSLKVLDNKVSEVFGKKMSWGDLFTIDRKLPKGSVTFWDGGEMKEHELTQGNLLYIYMADKMADGRMKLRRMGITEEDVEDIKNFLDPRFIELADWMQDEFLVDKRNEYNEVHKRMFGASMAAIENYFPLKILANARLENVDVADDTTDPALPATTTGSIIKRRRNNLALDVTGANAFSVILDHLQQMERWAAFAEFNRDLNTLLSYKRFRNQVMNMSSAYGAGKMLWNNFRNVCSMAAGAYRPPIAALDKAAVNIAKGVTAAKVSFRVFTALKQFLSMPAYASDSNPLYLAKDIVNPFGAWNWTMKNLPIFEKRWKSRMAGDPRLMKSDMDWKAWRSNVVQIASRIGMSPNAFVDALTVAIGTHAMYETKLAKYLRQGYERGQAERKAKQDATILFNQTQQSSEGAFLSTMQVDRSWLSVLFTVFRNSSMSYTRQLYDALRNLKGRASGDKQLSVEFMAKQLLREQKPEEEGAWSDDDWADARKKASAEYRSTILRDLVKVGIFGFALQMAWNLGAYLPYLLLGEDEEEKGKMWDDVMNHSFFGSIEGLTGGDVMSSAGQMAMNGDTNWSYLVKDMPLASDLSNILKKMPKDQASAMNDVVNLLVQSGIGVNPQSLTDAVVAVIDACGDDAESQRECALLIARVINCPQSQIDKIYFDELDLSGEEASKMTPAQIAERYADYKLMREAPLTGWTRSQETEDSIRGAKEKKVLKVAKEKITGRMATEETKRLLSEYDEVTKKETELSKLKKTDKEAYKQGRKELRESSNLKVHNRVKRYKKDMKELTEKYLKSRTPEERDSIVERMILTRERMLEDVAQ